MGGGEKSRRATPLRTFAAAHPCDDGEKTHKVDFESALAALRGLDLLQRGGLGLLGVGGRALLAHS